ncbi:hypothetical protein LZC95_24935 [Pendulispora brunnea]|uniref:PEGA domain-containing protein n=1 Tax=Pendulispora brunnea TaxID=2905690 RepID=A0ABZ2KN11_9BACT
MIRARWLVAVAAASSLALQLATPTCAFAQRSNGPSQADIRTARDLFAKAEKDQEAGQWAQALDKYQRVSAIKMTAGVRFRIALCEENLGRLLDAQADYTGAQEQARADSMKDVLDASTEALAQLKQRIPTLRVVIPAGVNDAEVLVDKKPIASSETGYVTSLEPGAHALEVHAPGRQPYAKTIKVVEREITTVEPPLLPVTQQPPAAVAVPPPAATTTPPQAPKETPPQQAAPEGRNLALPIATTVGAVALVGLGFGSYILAGNKADDARSKCEARGGDPCTDSRSTIRTFDALAITGWAAGAALGGLAIYLWTRPAPASSGTGTALTAPANGARYVRLVPWGQGMRLEGSF